MLPDYDIIGKRIKTSRLKVGITQEELANRLNVSVAYISRVERGVTSINLKRLIEIADILKVTASYLLSGSNATAKDYLRQDLSEVLDRCNPHKQKLIYEISQLVAKSKIYLD